MLEEKRLTTDLNFKSFAEFVLHEIRTGDYSFGSLHWLPQSQICPPCRSQGGLLAYDFLGHLDTLAEDFEELAGKFPELQGLDSVMRMKPNSVDGRTDRRSRAYFRQLDKALVRRLYHAYREDFILFGFEYPKDFFDIAQDP